LTFDHSTLLQASPAKTKGLEVPFSSHNPNYQVDLNAMPFGAKVAAIMTSELLNKGGN
jgi:hippurate hydrolase